MLSESKGSLLDDLNLIDALQESKTTSEAVTEQVRIAEATMVKIDAARENYRPCGLRAAILYFVLNDLVSIDGMYQFSLEAYEKLFTQSIERSADKAGMVVSFFQKMSLFSNQNRASLRNFPFAKWILLS
jgi:dynein heavy chain, axonemal